MHQGERVESGKLAAEDGFNMLQPIGQRLCLFCEVKFLRQADGFAEKVLRVAVMPCRMGVGTRIVKLVVGILTPPDALVEPVQPIFAFLFRHRRTC